MVDITNVDPNADQPQGGDAPEDNSEFEAAWDALEAKETAGDPPPDPKAEPDDPDAGEPQGPGGGAPPADASPQAADAGENQPDDPWKDAPEHLRALHQQEIDRRDATIRSNAGRLSRVTHDLNALRSQIESQRDAAGATEKGDEAKGKEDRLKQLREEYPEVAAPILDLLQSLEAEVKTLKSSEQVRTDAQVSELIDEQERYVTERHGDLFNEVRGDKKDAFLSWMGQQPKGIQDMIERNGSVIVDASEVNLVLDLFKASQGGEQRNELQERRERQLGAGRLPTTRGPGGSPSSKPKDEYDAAWDEFEARDQAKAAGRSR